MTIGGSSSTDWRARIIAVLSLLVSFASFGVSFSNYRLAKTEYSALLQVVDENFKITGMDASAPWLTPPPPPHPRAQSKVRARGYRYSSRLRNMGSKTVKVNQVTMWLRSEDDATKGERYVLGSGFYIRAGEDRAIEHELATDGG